VTTAPPVFPVAPVTSILGLVGISNDGTLLYLGKVHGTDSYLSQVKMSDIKKTKPRSSNSTGQNTYPAGSIRERILKAAFGLFSESGFSDTSMLDIVTRARVSKRDLYALFRTKHALLAGCIHERAEGMRRPLDTATSEPQTRETMAKLLVEFGVSILKTVCQPEALTVFRLAIAESDRAPEIARTLDNSGRKANQKMLAELLTKAQERRLVAAGDPAVLAARYFAALWGDVLLSLLMRVREAPTEREIETRARAAAETLMARR